MLQPSNRMQYFSFFILYKLIYDSQGTEFDQLEEGEKYEKLLELVLEPEGTVVKALSEATQITEADEVAHLLVRIFEANERGISLVKMVVMAEVAITGMF